MNSKKSNSFYQKLFKLVLPIAFQQFMLALVSASDAFMLGLQNQESLSAVSLASQVTFVENLFLTSMTLGLSMFAAQFWGNKDKESVEKIFAFVMKITVIVSLIFFFFSLCFPNLLMYIFTQDEALINAGAVYLRVVSASFILTAISQIYLCVLKNTGKASKTSIISSTSVVINIVFNTILIFGLLGIPKLEVAGAAIATVIAKSVEVIWCILETIRKDNVKLKAKYFLHDSKTIRKDFWKYTTPVLCNEIVWGCGFTMHSVIMGHLGSDAAAANSIANIAKNLVACFSLGVASGGGIIVGNELGMGNLETAKKYGKKIIVAALISGFAAGAVLLSVSPLVLHYAKLSETAKDYLQMMFFVCSVNLIGYAVNSSTVAGIFCAGGDTKFGLRCDAVVMWCIAIPSGLLAAFLLKAPVAVVFLILNADELIKLPAVFIHYRKYLWVRNLTKQEALEVKNV